MEKLNLDFSKEIDYEKIINDIKQNPLANQIIFQLNLTDEDIKRNYEYINNYIRINKKCLYCKAMSDCDHSTKGLQYNIKKDIDGDITDCFVVCKQFNDFYQRKNNLVLTTFDEDELLDEKQKNFLFDNASLLGQEFINKILMILKGQHVLGAFLQVNNSKNRLKLIKSLAYGLLLNHKVAIVKFSDMLKNIKTEFNIQTGVNTLKSALESDILIIDGIGNEAITTWSRDEILLSILDNRIQSDKITILCSEFSINDLKKLYKINYNDEAKVNQIIDKINEIRM